MTALNAATDLNALLNVRSDALEHALNLTNDNSFENVNSILTSQESAIPESLVQTLFDDSYNREHLSQVNIAYDILTGDYSNDLVEEAKAQGEFKR